MKKILITGAGGFVGTHLTRALQETGTYEVFAAVYKSTSDIASLVPADHIIEGDLTDYAFAEALVAKSRPDIIFHLAALSVVHSSAKDATHVINSNTTISYNILEATKLSSLKTRFVAICSANEYGLVQNYHKPIDEHCPLRPLNPYAVSKVTQEMLAQEYSLAYGLDVVMLRPFNHTGTGQTTDFVVPALAKQFAEIASQKKEPIIEVGNLETTRDFTDVRDMVQAYILAAERGKSGEIYNIGSGVGVKVADLIAIFQKISGVTVTVKVKDQFVRLADVPILVCDATKFIAVSSWKPQYKLEEALLNVYNYWKEQI